MYYQILSERESMSRSTESTRRTRYTYRHENVGKHGVRHGDKRGTGVNNAGTSRAQRDVLNRRVDGHEGQANQPVAQRGLCVQNRGQQKAGVGRRIPARRHPSAQTPQRNDRATISEGENALNFEK